MTATKIVTAIVIFGINLALGVALGFFMLVALNGFPERAGGYGLLLYAAGGAVVTLAAAGGGFLLAGRLLERGWSALPAALVPVVALTVVAFVLKIVLFFAGVVLAGALRPSR